MSDEQGPESSVSHDSSLITHHPIACPFCESPDTEVISPFGSQLLVSQHRCRACRSYFEALRDDRWEG